MVVPAWISENFRVLVAHELALGNPIARIDQPAGTRCPLAVNFVKPLDFSGFARLHQLPVGVETWENRDAHYDIQAGYICTRTRHVIAGPIA
jgi:hypothetical protein